MDTIETLLREARSRLVAAELPEPRRDAELMLCRILDRDRSFLLSHPEQPVPSNQSSRFRDWVRRRSDQYPIQYLLGIQEFYGRPFEVDPRVLIPRPETELLVETALELLENHSAPRIVDVGTGSGCIAVTLACERPDSCVVATEISPGALEVARANARRHGVVDRIRFRRGSILDPVRAEDAFDLIVSNPPYVAFDDPRVTPEVARNEPREAVFSGRTGLEIHEELFRQASSVVKPDGRLVIEIGAGQSVPVSRLAAGQGWELGAVHRDLAHIERCLVFRRLS